MSEREARNHPGHDRQISADQLVAYNMAVYRKALAMTQGALAELLAWHTGRPWSKASVSAAERSWDGDRTKYFSAEQMLALAESLQVPVNALLLPPPDDGGGPRYILAPLPPPHSLEMEDVLRLLFPEPDTKGPSIDVYRSRLAKAFESSPGAADLNDLGDPRAPQDGRDLAERLEAQRHALLSVAEEMDKEICRIRQKVQQLQTNESD